MGGVRRRGAGDVALAAYLVGLMLWAFAVIGTVAAIVVSHLVLGDWCSDPDTSAAGRAHWSWGEMGRVCTWRRPDGSYETGPGMRNWAILLTLLAAGFCLLRTSAWIRRARGTAPEGSLVATPTAGERDDVSRR